MRKTCKAKSSLLVTLMLSFLPIALLTPGYAQDPDEETRKIWDTAFINTSRAKSSKRRKSRRSYRIATPKIPVSDVAEDAVVGVTIWRLRRSTPADSGERLLVHEGSDDVEWLPERISASTRLAQGDRLRISVEAARSGYLYVIDREQYADGSLGEPYLIFPTTRTLAGDNSVKRGKLIEIPAQEDSPPYFRMRRSRPDQVAEVLSVFVTPTPIEGLEIKDKAQKLSDDQVAEWEQQWSAQVGSIELEDGAGKPWTKEEKLAGASPGSASVKSGLLNASAPAPQLIYYRPNAKASEPLLVKVQLRYRSNQANQ